MVRVGKYNYEKSTRKDKKLMTRVDGQLIHFGDAKAQHYYDKTDIWSQLNHYDTKRRASYRARHSAIKLADGRIAINDPRQPAYHSYRILW